MADTNGKQVPEKDDFTAFKMDSNFTGGSENPVYELVGKIDPSYSMVNTGTVTINRENIYTDADTYTTRNNGSKNSKGEDNTKNKKPICLIAILVIIMMLMLMAACFIALFLELASLKSELSSFKQTLPSERAQQLNASIEGSFSNIERRFEDIGMEQLNISVQVQERLQDTVNQLIVHIHENFSTIEDRLTELEDIENLQDSRIQQINTSLAGLHPSFPATSCAALPPSSPSGYYWVRASNGSAVRVYCDMTRSCGGVTGGWRRVAELDMTNSSHQCPSGLRQRADSNLRTCVRDSDSPGCSSVTFSSATLEYSRVCGKIIGYQVGTTDAFGPNDINTYYVDGVSLTHGTPRQHIWSFAAAHDEAGSCAVCNCPCTNTNTASQATQPQPFVGNDYFCDTGSSERPRTTTIYSDDPLWDGAGCGPLNTCCSLNNPPWFYKQLPQPTTDDIEMRICRSSDTRDEDIAIEMVEIYVQ